MQRLAALVQPAGRAADSLLHRAGALGQQGGHAVGVGAQRRGPLGEVAAELLAQLQGGAGGGRAWERRGGLHAPAQAGRGLRKLPRSGFLPGPAPQASPSPDLEEVGARGGGQAGGQAAHAVARGCKRRHQRLQAVAARGKGLLQRGQAVAAGGCGGRGAGRCEVRRWGTEACGRAAGARPCIIPASGRSSAHLLRAGAGAPPPSRPGCASPRGGGPARPAGRPAAGCPAGQGAGSREGGGCRVWAGQGVLRSAHVTAAAAAAALTPGRNSRIFSSKVCTGAGASPDARRWCASTAA